jgi:serine/threonine protein kinase
MEYIQGITLKERLIGLRTGGEKMPIAEAATIVREVAAALDHAHAHGLVHRDVKPANILLRDGADEQSARQAILTDFGIAKILEGVQLTATGMSMGTPDYMAPEQVSGDPVGAQTDVYALGVVYFEMLTNVLPFSADTPIAVLLKHMSDEPPSPRLLVPDLPATLDEVLRRALAKKPRDRYASAGDFAAAIDAALTD